MNIEKLFEAFIETEISIDYTAIKWGNEYTGPVKTTRHARVAVAGEIISYDYQNIKQLIAVLDKIPFIKIRLNGELINEIKLGTIKDS